MQNDISREIRHKILKMADELNQSGHPEAAIEILSKSIKRVPHVKDLYYALIETLMEGQQYQQALQVIADFPSEDVDIRCAEFKGECLERQKRFDEAEEVADQVLSLNPTSASALNLKGILLHQRKANQAARIFFEQSIQSNPDYGPAYMNLGLLDLENSQSYSAVEFLVKAFVLAPQIKEVANTFHEVTTELGSFAEAEAMFRDACRRYPRNKRLYYLLVDILIQQHKLKDSMAAIETCIAAFGVDDGILVPALKVRSQLGLKAIDPKTEAAMSLSLCMIVKDEESSLARCLENAKETVDEIVVVDTGSSDKSADIARVFGARVYSCDWQNDFAKARNFALGKATGKWIFILDADEVVSPRDHELLNHITQSPCDGLVAYSFVTRNYTEDVGTEGWQANNSDYQEEQAGKGWFPSEKVRLFPNDRRIRFENAVHELVEPSLRREGIPIKKCPVPIHHYGTLDRKKEMKKKTLYYSLGKEKIANNRVDPSAMVEHAIQAQEVGDWEAALNLWEEVLGHCPNLPKAYFNLSYVHIQLEQYDHGLEAARKAVELDPGLKEAILNFALCQIRIGHVQQAIEDLNNFLLTTPQHPMGTGLLAVAYCIEGERDLGLGLFDDIRHMGFNCSEYIVEHVKKLKSAGQTNAADMLLGAIAESPYVDEQIRSMLGDSTCCHVNTSPIRICFYDLEKVNQNFQQHLEQLEDYCSLDDRFFATANDEKNADFIFFPYSIDPLYHQLGHQSFIELLRQLPGFNKNEHKFVFFLLDDISFKLDITSVIYRVNHDQRKMDVNSITLPYFIDDVYHTPLTEMPPYHVNFIGAIVTHVLRVYMLIPFLEKEQLPLYDLLLGKFEDLIANRKNPKIYLAIMTDAMSFAQRLFPLVTAPHGIKYFIDISVEQYPQLPRHIQKAKRKQLIEMMMQSVATLCPKGFGVQSIRFFETLAAGRIPILISDNYRLPLENRIDYASLLCQIDESDILKLNDRVADFFRLHSVEDLYQKANAARDVWKNYFAPSKQSNYIHLTLSDVLQADYCLNKI